MDMISPAPTSRLVAVDSVRKARRLFRVSSVDRDVVLGEGTTVP